MQCSLTKREGDVLLLLAQRKTLAQISVFLDENADGDFRIEADVNLDATQEEGEVIFKNYRVGFVEDLAE